MTLFILSDEKFYINLLKLLNGWQSAAQNGSPWAVEIIPDWSKRTDRQNRYYWASLQDLSEDAPIRYSKEVWGEYFRKLFLPPIELPDGSLGLMSTSKLKIKEFNEYMDQINRWTSTELGLQFGKSPDESGGF